jgi:hypothetical protein
MSKGVCSWDLCGGNELCLERFGMECFAYVVFGGVVSHIQINSLFENTWAFNHFALVKVVVGQKAL